jgi:hypothetical protein
MDVAIFKEQNCYGARMCLRNTRGHFIKTQTLWRHRSPLPQEVKAWSLEQTISWLNILFLL